MGLDTISEELISLLKTKRLVIATVESCTGGLLARELTRIPGASEVFWGSLITYDNAAKVGLAELDPELLKHYGAVSPEVAIALAHGGLVSMRRSVLHHPPSTMADPLGWVTISTTGITGPSGGTLEKPVGLCYTAVALNHGGQALRPRIHFEEIREVSGLTRDEYQTRFAEQALQLAAETIHVTFSQSLHK